MFCSGGREFCRNIETKIHFCRSRSISRNCLKNRRHLPSGSGKKNLFEIDSFQVQLHTNSSNSMIDYYLTFSKRNIQYAIIFLHYASYKDRVIAQSIYRLQILKNESYGYYRYVLFLNLILPFVYSLHYRSIKSGCIH